MKKKGHGQLKIAATLPPLRKAKADWRAAMAMLEEWESDVELKEEQLKASRVERDKADEAFRVASIMLRECEDAADGRQEAIDGTPPKTNKPS